MRARESPCYDEVGGRAATVDMSVPMARSEDDNGVHLKDTRAYPAQFLFLAGFASLVLVPIGAAFVTQGDWGGLVFLAIPAALVVVGKWMARIIPEDDDYVVLYPDRMEFPDCRARKSVRYWSDVEGIRWPAHHADDPVVRITVSRGEEGMPPWTLVSLKCVSPADRVKLIRYLRDRGAEMEQERWPEFCCRFAVPLVEECQHEERVPEAGEEVEAPASSPGVILWRLGSGRPFLRGLLGPLLIVLVVSRKAWWMVSVIVAVSSVINIRLVWGHWASPFTEACLGFAGATFLAGWLSLPDDGRSAKRDSELWGGSFLLATGLIGMPLLTNGIALGWIPAELREWVLWGGVLLLPLPIVIHIYRRDRRERRRRPAKEADALRRWAVYESTGRLPESELRE